MYYSIALYSNIPQWDAYISLESDNFRSLLDSFEYFSGVEKQAISGGQASRHTDIFSTNHINGE